MKNNEEKTEVPSRTQGSGKNSGENTEETEDYPVIFSNIDK
jgi:hypothetical protein